MPTIDVFKTQKGEPVVEIGAVGLVDDKDGVSLERASRSMRELQDEDRKPLTGKQLLEAAKEFADRNGLLVGRASVAADDEAPVVATDNAPASAPETEKE